MILLVDTGPLVALLDKKDSGHHPCVAAASRISSAVLGTTWPCFVEAMYLIGEVGGYRYQEQLWKLFSSGRLRLLDATARETSRMQALMEKYQDVPMDLADASLIACAEANNLRTLFTLDKHFLIYRLDDKSLLDLIPGFE